MAMPTDIGIIDTMVGFPSSNRSEVYKFLAPQLRDAESKDFKFPAQYMFKDVPDDLENDVDPVAVLIDNLDRFGIAQAMVSVAHEHYERAAKEHPGRFIPTTSVDPNQGMDAVRSLVDLHERYGIKSCTVFPAGCLPQVPINDKKLYPIYAKCIELDIAVFVCAGVPGPRVPMAPQRVELIDEVCYDFPELRFVMRHGAEPWTDLAVKLMLKWPNLYYSTSAFAPKHYPKSIVAYANTRGADKVLYAGYFPAGLTYDRIMGDMPAVPFHDDVWPKFLRDNARKVLKLDD